MLFAVEPANFQPIFLESCQTHSVNFISFAILLTDIPLCLFRGLWKCQNNFVVSHFLKMSWQFVHPSAPHITNIMEPENKKTISVKGIYQYCSRLFLVWYLIYLENSIKIISSVSVTFQKDTDPPEKNMYARSYAYPARNVTDFFPVSWQTYPENFAEKHLHWKTRKTSLHSKTIETTATLESINDKKILSNVPIIVGGAFCQIKDVVHVSIN